MVRPEYSAIMDDGGLEHRTGLLTAFLALAGAGVGVMASFATTTNLVWPIIPGGAATTVGAYGALAVLYRLWPFQRRPDPLMAQLQALLAEGNALIGPEQKSPGGPPVGDAATVRAWYTNVEEALAGQSQLVERFKRMGGLMFDFDSEGVRRYKELATKINNLKQIIDKPNTRPSPPGIIPPPVVIPPATVDPTLPYN